MNLMFPLLCVGLLGLIMMYVVTRMPPPAGGGSVPDDDMEATMTASLAISTAGSATF